MSDRMGSSAGGVEDPLAPQPGPSHRHKVGPTSKRKAPDEEESQAGTSKRTKSSQANTSANRSKTIKGEKKAGGLIINPILPTSNAASGPSSSTAPPSRPASAQGASSSRTRDPSQSKRKPPDQLNITRLDDSATLEKSSKGKGKAREIVAPTRQDIEADEDVRRMDDERERLRVREAHAQSQSAEFKTPLLPKPSSVPRRRQTGFAFAAPPSTPGKGASLDLTQPIPVRDTPTIDRNRAMRGEPVKRRSSMSMRGKRVSGSFENTGVIPQPHPSVPTSNFTKHIDRELPEAHRARHLLVWCTARTSAPSTNASTSTSRADTPPLPPLTAEGANILQDVQKEIQKMLTEQQVDISFSSRMDDDTDRPKVKEHEQNVKNRKREDDFMRHIERSKQEDTGWSTSIQSYNARQASTVDAIARQRHQSGSSANWVPLDASDPQYDREVWGAQLARTCKEAADRRRDRSPLSLRMGEVESKVDRAHATLHVSDQLAKRTTRHLNKRFEALATALAARSQPPTEVSTLASLVSADPNPPSATGLGAPPDTLSILRALTRTDVERPRVEMGDAARRAAREVQRVNATSGRSSVGAGERRLTAVRAPTPRKATGTPRRAGTPRQRSEEEEGGNG